MIEPTSPASSLHPADIISPVLETQERPRKDALANVSANDFMASGSEDGVAGMSSRSTSPTNILPLDAGTPPGGGVPARERIPEISSLSSAPVTASSYRSAGVLLPPSKSAGLVQPTSELRIVAIEDVLIHEIHDPRRTGRLVVALQADGMQRHPVIVVRTRDGSYIHLDGANRLTALAQLGYKYVAVQVLDYADDAAVTLDNWVHLVSIASEDLRPRINDTQKGHYEVYELQPHQVAGVLKNGMAAAAVMFRQGPIFGLLTDIGLADRIAAVEALTGTYHESPVREVLPQGLGVAAGMAQLLEEHPSATTCVAFTPLMKQDVLTLAHNMERRIPAGITRHIVTCGRLLNVNVPLSLLEDGPTADERTEQLARLLEGSTWRPYEPTYVREQY